MAAFDELEAFELLAAAFGELAVAVLLDEPAADEEAIPEVEEAELSAEDELTSTAAPIFEEEAAALEVFTFF